MVVKGFDMWHRRSVPPLLKLVEFLVVILVPVILVLTSARLMMTAHWLKNEMTFERVDLLANPDEHLRMRLETLDYLFSHAQAPEIRFSISPNSMIYNSREQSHLIDVKKVMLVTLIVYKTLIAVLVTCLVLLIHDELTRHRLSKVLILAGLLTLTLMTVGVLAITMAWDSFFVGFHKIFFADGTWQFLETDMLIQLFPELFWVHTAVAIVILTSLWSVLVSLVSGLPWFSGEKR